MYGEMESNHSLPIATPILDLGYDPKSASKLIYGIL